MLFHHIKPASRLRRFRSRGYPLVLAVFSFRYDAHLVPDLIGNLRPLVDGWAGFDDRNSKELFSNEPHRRGALIERARQLGAKWVLAVDPDERLEAGAAEQIRRMTAEPARILWTFRLCELYTPTAYRTDGVWGRKRMTRLFPLLEDQQFSTHPLHGPWNPVEGRYEKRDSGLNIYHLKMITRSRREARRDLYATLDPDRKFQKIGYEYLADESGATFEEIAPGREYLPVHVEDDGLWMPKTRSPQSMSVSG